MELTCNLRKMRLQKDMRQQDVADYLNVQRSTYTKYEKGAIPVKAEHLSRLAALYGVSVDYLLGLQDSTKPEDKSPIPTTQNITPIEDAGLTSDEEILLKRYRMLDDEWKELARANLFDLVKRFE